jgi:transposase InsO family protein
MEERMKFMLMYRSESWSMTELCEVFGVSRKTGYKWLKRYEQAGMEGLRELSRAPHVHPNAVAPEIEEAIVDLKQQRTKRGPKKLLEILQRQRPEARWPVQSTIGAILKRHGLVRSRRRCRKTPPYEQPFAGYDHPNAVWSADLKGWFKTGDGQRCDPLTITDNYSRYLIRCQAVRPASFEAIQPVFVGAFHEYGLPEAIRTDNGPPSPVPLWAAYRSCRSGGSSWVLSRNGSDRGNRSKTVGMNECIEPSRMKRSLHPSQPGGDNRSLSTDSVRSSITKDHMNP